MRPRLALTRSGDGVQTSTRSRRGFLAGAAATTAMLAGCISGDDTDDSNDEEENGDEGDAEDGLTADPAYAEWLTTEDDWLFLAYANFDTATPSDEGELTFDPDEEVDDPLVTYPLDVGGASIGLFSLGLWAADLFAVVDPEEESESEASDLLVVNGTVIVRGTFNTDELNEWLTDDSEPFTATYEQTGEIRGYDRYDPDEVPEGVEDAPVVAVDEETLLLDSDADRLEQVASVGDGDQSSATEEDETIAWLVEQVGDGDIVTGQVGPVPTSEFDPEEFLDNGLSFQPADGEDVLAAATFDPDAGELDAHFALAADDLDEATSQTVEDEFGTAGSDRSVSTDDDRLTASATYDADDIGAGVDEERGELSQAEAEELVSMDALEFRYEPPVDDSFGELWIDVVEETDAAALRAEADSGAFNEIGPQEGTVDTGFSLPVQVDPDGDEVTVFAVDEADAAGELVSKQVPTDELSSDEVEQSVPADALEFQYDSPEAGDFGSLSIEVASDTEAEIIVAQPREAPGSFSDGVGSLDADEPVETGTSLQVAVDPDGDEVIVFATVDGATGEVTRWEGP